ncbi:murein biosynthesis integral membrane protein MurJ [Actinophytocola sp.]|uniref:murein biosynthesis integral membrane protein MurJ n=1 Tax=Actinophytocola sp. TaxID=1872138 RepID=UPI00389A5B81
MLVEARGVAVASAVSRLTGYVRTASLGAALGGSLVADIYANAVLVPAVVESVILGAAFSGFLVRLLTGAVLESGEDEVLFVQRLVTLTFVCLGILATAMWLSVDLLANLFADVQARALLTQFLYLVIPTFIFSGMYLVYSAVLNVHRRFRPAAWAPVGANMLVSAIAWYVAGSLRDGQDSPATFPRWIAILIAGATLMASIFQVVVLIPFLRSVRVTFRARFDFSLLPLRSVARNFLWGLVAAGSGQASIVVIAILANRASVQGYAGLFIFNNVYLLMAAAHGVITLSINTVVLPRMSEAAHGLDRGDVAAQADFACVYCVLLLVPVSVVFLVLSGDIGRLLFQWGRFSPADLAGMAPVIAVAAVALVPFSLSQIVLMAFWAFEDLRTVALLGFPTYLLRIVLSIAAFVVLHPRYATAGTMGALAISFLLEIAIARHLLRRRKIVIWAHGATRTMSRALLAGLAASVFTAVFTHYMLAAAPTAKVAEMLYFGAGCCCAVVSYVVFCWLFQVSEMRRLVTVVTGWLRS